MTSESIHFRPGSLAALLAKRLAKTGETQSQFLRRVVAAELGVKEPAMDGNERVIRRINAGKRAKKRKGGHAQR